MRRSTSAAVVPDAPMISGSEVRGLHGAEHGHALVVGQQRRLAGRRADDEAGDAVGGQAPDQRGERVVVDARPRGTG